MSRVVSSAYSLSRSNSKRSTFSSSDGGERVFRFGWKSSRYDSGMKSNLKVEDMKIDEALMRGGAGGVEMVEIPKAAYAAFSFGERGGSITDPSSSTMRTPGRRGMGKEGGGFSIGGVGNKYCSGDVGPSTPYRQYTSFDSPACPGAWVRSPMDAVPRLPSMSFDHQFSVFDEFRDE